MSNQQVSDLVLSQEVVDLEKHFDSLVGKNIRLQGEGVNDSLKRFVQGIAQMNSEKNRGELISTILRLRPEIQCACFEYLNKSAPYLTEKVSYKVKLKNMSKETVRVVLDTREIRRPIPKSTEYLIEQRPVHEVLQPGEEIEVATPKAVDLLYKYGRTSRVPFKKGGANPFPSQFSKEYPLDEIGFSFECRDYGNGDELVAKSYSSEKPQEKPSKASK